MLRFLIAMLALFGAAGQARAEWHRVETPDFVLQAEMPEPKLRSLAAELVAFDRALRLVTGVTAPVGTQRTRILIGADVPSVIAATRIEDFDGSTRLISRLFDVILLARSYPGLEQPYDLRSLLFHQYAHAFMRRHQSYNQPFWFIEGFASYFQTAQILPDGIVRLGARPAEFADADMAATPFAELMAYQPDQQADDIPAGLDTGGWLLTHHYYAKGKRSEEIGRYIQSVRAGQAVPPVKQFFQGGSTGLDADMAAYQAAPLATRDVTIAAVDPASLTVRPSRPGEVLLIELQFAQLALQQENGALETQPDETRSKAITERLDALFERGLAGASTHPQDTELGYYVARFALMAHKSKEADTLVDRLLLADPDNPDFLALKGDILTYIARNEQPQRFMPLITRSRTLIRRAQAIDPGNRLAAAAMYRNISADQGGTPAAQQLLARAIALDPTNFDLLISGVERRINSNNMRGAIALLRPLANDPHDNILRRVARAMILDLRSRRFR
ncbi:hypothetical protein P1X14_21035 [Sphingomonas sp. AOB5]|uniref:tetratricopeptide repeat protein n=1 Tax=Sphingomonas sp. AOB5 TaxID=3034017 RepID=UPI0023F74F53|nr:hypothetical protein [Sphingomonas sp. AOB5]MDF7777754.1 hypothetical protein [Sphingomonas sp. AOB5]